MKRVLVTEINCPADQKLVAYLLSQNFIVRIIAECIDAGNPLLRLPVEIYPGSLSDAAAVIKSAKGCDYIIKTQPANTGKEGIKECICQMHETMNVMEAALTAGVKTLLHISRSISLPMIQRMLAGTRTVSMKIILVETLISTNDNMIDDYDNYAKEVVRILRTGKHANSYVIDELKATGDVHWNKNFPGYLQASVYKSIQAAKKLKTSRWAFNISKLFTCLLGWQQMMQDAMPFG